MLSMSALPPGTLVGVVFIVLLLLPMKLAPVQLKLLAFFIWLTGGLAMSYNGIVRVNQAGLDSTMLMVALGASMLVGILKGKFILSKTSDRNVERLNTMTEPQRPLAVYSARSWIVIGVMVLIAVSLNLFGAPLLWRGVIALGIGMGLVVSSMRYLKATAIA